MNELHLFAGAGGGILGGILLGHTTVCAVEIEPYARKVLLQRQRDGILPKFPIWDDVCTFDGKPWKGKVDIVCGGFPCQDISIAGKGAGIEGERSSMWRHMARIISEIRPNFTFVENSPMLVGRGLAVVLADLAAMGYNAKWGIVGADDAGAPHQRKRIWIMAYASSGRRQEQRPKSKKTRDFGEQSMEMANSTQLLGDGSDHNGGIILLEESLSESRNNSWAANIPNTNLPHGEGMRCAKRGEPQRTNTHLPGAWWRQDPAEQVESGVGRMANGVAARVDRLKCIGNGQVPAVARLAWEILMEK